MTLERDADDIASCFALEQLLVRDGPGQVLEGEVTGLIPAGAFLAFGPSPREGAGEQPPPFEGMLPVRRLRAPRVREQAGAARRRAAAERERGRSGRAGRDGRRGGPEPGREWWELNEQGTILRGERSGATVRLGDVLPVRVGRIDAVRGRVDLEQVG